MPASPNPFLDPAAVRSLYETCGRLASRTEALHDAKIAGSHAAETIASLAAASPLPASPVIADIGCGRGSTTRTLAERIPAAELLAIDASAALLTAARERTATFPGRVQAIRADFHALPLHDHSCDLAVAAFCLYHSHRPETVIGEIARCLTPAGSAILVTKSADSYRELDELITSCGLDPAATSRRSLYESAHSTNLPAIASTTLEITAVRHDRHQFRFRDLNHLADYLATTPKYNLPPALRSNPAKLSAELRRRLPNRPVETTSTVTYILGRPRVRT